MRRDLDDRSALFRSDATFCAETHPDGKSVALRSLNYPDQYVRYRDNGEVWLDPEDDTESFRSGTALDVVAPWAG